MARRMRGRHRRRTRVAWFAPRTNHSANLDDWSVSCWADVGAPFAAIGSTSGLPTRVISPIVDLRVQALDPTVEPNLVAHPLDEALTVQRVRGQVNIECFGTQGFLDGFFVHMGVCQVQTGSLGDAISVPSPTLNDSCLQDWLWLHHADLSSGSHACFDCTGQATCPKSSANGCDLVDVNMPTVLTAFQFFGVPQSIWVDVDVKAKRRIRPEHVLVFVLEAEAGSSDAAERDVLSCTPKLRALISRSV